MLCITFWSSLQKLLFAWTTAKQKMIQQFLLHQIKEGAEKIAQITAIQFTCLHLVADTKSLFSLQFQVLIEETVHLNCHLDFDRSSRKSDFVYNGFQVRTYVRTSRFKLYFEGWGGPQWCPSLLTIGWGIKPIKFKTTVVSYFPPFISLKSSNVELG